MADDDFPLPHPPAEHHPRCRCGVIVVINWRMMIEHSLNEAFGNTDPIRFQPLDAR